MNGIDISFSAVSIPALAFFFQARTLGNHNDFTHLYKGRNCVHMFFHMLMLVKEKLHDIAYLRKRRVAVKPSASRGESGHCGQFDSVGFIKTGHYCDVMLRLAAGKRKISHYDLSMILPARREKTPHCDLMHMCYLPKVC